MINLSIDGLIAALKLHDVINSFLNDETEVIDTPTMTIESILNLDSFTVLNHTEEDENDETSVSDPITGPLFTITDVRIVVAVNQIVSRNLTSLVNLTILDIVNMSFVTGRTKPSFNNMIHTNTFDVYTDEGGTDA